MKYRVEQEKIKFRILKQTCIILFILFIDIDEIPGQGFLGLIFYPRINLHVIKILSAVQNRKTSSVYLYYEC